MVHKDLTQKQKRFAELMITRDSSYEAYKEAFGLSDCKLTTVAPRASKLLKNPKIIAYMDVIRLPIIKKNRLTLQDHLDKLEEIRDHALSSGNYSAAVSAEVSRGKAVGLYVERSESTVRSLNANITVPPEQLKDIAKALLNKI